MPEFSTSTPPRSTTPPLACVSCITPLHLVEDDSWVEQVVRVKHALDAPHDGRSLRPPLHLNKGSHVATSAVLTLFCMRVNTQTLVHIM